MDEKEAPEYTGTGIPICPHTKLPCYLSLNLEHMNHLLTCTRKAQEALTTLVRDTKLELALSIVEQTLVKRLVFGFVGVTLLAVVTLLLLKAGIVVK